MHGSCVCLVKWCLCSLPSWPPLH